jgi:hypothetical protein
MVRVNALAELLAIVMWAVATRSPMVQPSVELRAGQWQPLFTLEWRHLHHIP